MLNLLAVFLVCSGIGIAVHIAIDLTHRPQSMKIMNAVWILTALWGSYLALWAYNKFGQGAPMKMGGGEMKMDMSVSYTHLMNRFFCSAFETFRKNLMMTVPFSVR